MKTKAKKFQQGGDVGDDVRARAMRFIKGETDLSGKYHGDADPLAGVIKAAEARDRTRMAEAPTSQSRGTTKPRFSSDVYANARRELAGRGIGFDKTPALADIHQMIVNEEERRGRRYKSGGVVKSASKRADGVAQRGRTRGKVC